MATERRPILVVDDEPDIREMLREYLESLGHAVLEAGNGLEALLAVKRHRPGVVLLDLKMPRLDGFGTIKHIQKFDASIRIVVVSGYVDEAAQARLKALGVAVLPKPLNRARLDDLLR